jgi:predicted Zn-dependent protease
MEALRRDPNQAEVRITLGGIYLGQSKYAEAAEELRRALRFQPQSDDAHRLLGDVLVKLGSRTKLSPSISGQPSRSSRRPGRTIIDWGSSSTSGGSSPKPPASSSG